MGQKVHPIGIRLGIVKDWSSKWYADSKTFPKYVFLDHKIRVYIKEKLKDASVSAIIIERQAAKANITIMTARPGIVIGKNCVIGSGITLKSDLASNHIIKQ